MYRNGKNGLVEMIKRLFQALALMVLLTAVAPLSLSAQTVVPSVTSDTLKWGDGPKALAFFTRGKAYHDGDGVAQNYAKARIYYIKAANLGSNDARVNLGYLYFMGEGVEQNYAKARNWYLSAAREGDKPAQYNLAMIYENGLGVRKNPQKAKYWRELAKGTSTTEAAKLEPSINPAQRAKAAAPNIIPPDNSKAVVQPVSSEATASLTAQPSHLTLKRPNFTAPDWVRFLIAFILFVLVTICAIWFTIQYKALKALRLSRAFGNAFYANHRDTLRTSYLRYPEQRRSYNLVGGPWVVAMCVLMVRFAKENSGAASLIGQQSRKTLRALEEGGGLAGRQSVFPIVASLQARIFSDINAVDNAPDKALSPVHYHQEALTRDKTRKDKAQHLRVV